MKGSWLDTRLWVRPLSGDLLDQLYFEVCATGGAINATVISVSILVNGNKDTS